LPGPLLAELLSHDPVEGVIVAETLGTDLNLVMRRRGRHQIRREVPMICVGKAAEDDLLAFLGNLEFPPVESEQVSFAPGLSIAIVTAFLDFVVEKVRATLCVLIELKGPRDLTLQGLNPLKRPGPAARRLGG
jgi:hypothetical protein